MGTGAMTESSTEVLSVSRGGHVLQTPEVSSPRPVGVTRVSLRMRSTVDSPPRARGDDPAVIQIPDPV